MRLVFPRQDSSDNSAPALNPSLIVGICILGAIFFCVILASVIRLCQRLPQRPSYSAENPPHDLFRPYSQDQVERMREVRWLNHSEMWETGKMARMEMGEQFGPRPKLNRRTGVGWGFVVGKDGYLRKANGVVSMEGGASGGDAWSSQGTSGESRNSIVNDPGNTAARQQQPPRPESSHIWDCDPSMQQSQYRQHYQYRKPLPSKLHTTYEGLDRSDDEGLDDIVLEPFPDLPQISPGIKQRFREQEYVAESAERGNQLRIVENDDTEQYFVNASAGTVLKEPVITLNEETQDMIPNEIYEHGDAYATAHGIEMRDLTGNAR